MFAMSIYDYTLPARDGSQISMENYRGKVLLIVNTATGCGFTPHYAPIEEMYEKYHDQGFEVIDVPCNQFAGQTPGTDEEIHEFCTLKYNTQFPQMKKSDVNGENELPLYTYLKSQKGFEGFGKGPAALMMSGLLKTIDKDYKNNPEIKWNFTKFLVDRAGNVVARFEPTVDMADVENFRVPPHLVMNLEHATFSNIEHQSIDFAVHTIRPWLVRIEQAMNRALFTDQEKGRFYVQFNMDGLMRGDYKSRMEGYAIGINNGFMSPNDIRALENLNPIPAEEGGDTYLVNGNMMPLKMAGAAYRKEPEHEETESDRRTLRQPDRH